MEENTKKLIGATATPLASIFGSGFLVIVPILAGAVGPYSWLALASRAFAFYYTLQCLVTFNISIDQNQRVGIALVAAALGFITLFAVPAG